MSRKNVVSGKRLATAQSLASDFQTDPITVNTLDNVGFHVATASVTDNTGTFGVEVRIRESENVVSEWASLTLSSTPTLADTNNQYFINLNQLPPCEVRLTFTAAGGTPDGTCAIFFSGTEV